jgi:hypothetical protein
MTAPERIWLQDAGDFAGARAACNEFTWCAAPVDDDDTGYVRADIHDRVVALLREALVKLRAEAQGLILTEARLERREGGFVPRPETVDADACALVDPLLDLLRRAEAMVGRPPGGAPWLDDLLDGRATLGTRPQGTQ